MARASKAEANIPLTVLVYRSAMEQRKSISDYADVLKIGGLSLRQFVQYKTRRPRSTTLASLSSGLNMPLEEIHRRLVLMPSALPPFKEWLSAKMEGRFSRSALSQATGISDSALKNYITGRLLPEPHMARKIADVLGLDLTETAEVVVSNYVAVSGDDVDPEDDVEDMIEETAPAVEPEPVVVATPATPPPAEPTPAAPPAPASAPIAAISSDEERLLKLWHKLHPQGRRAAMLYMAGLLAED